MTLFRTDLVRNGEHSDPTGCRDAQSNELDQRRPRPVGSLFDGKQGAFINLQALPGRRYS
ncbi:hypothetical protein [Natrialba taiwanensis]|uniref:hypothetical protein n=1 Tax=Natrialba taiwanensis TaxID=160846 RepID=UPI000677682B|nr:hypothetical protein [Natrialba taiwanensis]